MYLANLRQDRGETPVVVDPRRGFVEAERLPLHGPASDVLALLAQVGPAELARLVAGLPAAAFRPLDAALLTAPYRRPRKLWGIGLNYVEHAGDLAESVPDEPASFLKADHTIIGPDEPIPLPSQSRRVTAEAELGLVIGRTCRNVSEAEALDHVWGVCPVLDQTAEDILQRNPRFLTRAKNFPGFFSFGPGLVPLTQVLAEVGTLGKLEVATVRNGSVHRSNVVANMRYGPEFLVSFHSRVMPLYPGDIISTGTPGAVEIHPGDMVECDIPGVGRLGNPVVAG
jgi:2-keto-4-pentenoate hydratase/2-oxohepta-3-ene-1,7-dioic acid hydratase in catechol pathway